MELGDVLIRDVRQIHRGTPNRSDQPRPMVVRGYSRRWLYRPEVNIRVPQQTWDPLPPRSQQLLRFNPIVADGDAPLDNYRQFTYQAMHGTPDLLWLHAGNTRMALAPAVGGAIAALYTLDHPSLLTDPPAAFHWLRPATPAAMQAHDMLRMASFALVPWCNRIRDGQAQVLGHSLGLPNTGGLDHTIMRRSTTSCCIARAGPTTFAPNRSATALTG